MVKRFGQFTLDFDRIGFPMIGKKQWGFSISLFPVTKYQFERFLNGCGPSGELFTDSWYRNILKKNPRCSWRSITDERPWELFLTGLTPEEIGPFLKYHGKGFRLPRVDERNLFLAESDELKNRKTEILRACREAEAGEPVCRVIEAGLFPLLSEGFLEPVEAKVKGRQMKIRYTGRPFYDLWPALFPPDQVCDVDLSGEIIKAVGFRMACDH